jgi:hypothetical protein
MSRGLELVGSRSRSGRSSLSLSDIRPVFRDRGAGPSRPDRRPGRGWRHLGNMTPRRTSRAMCSSFVANAGTRTIGARSVALLSRTSTPEYNKREQQRTPPLLRCHRPAADINRHRTHSRSTLPQRCTDSARGEYCFVSFDQAERRHPTQRCRTKLPQLRGLPTRLAGFPAAGSNPFPVGGHATARGS